MACFGSESDKDEKQMHLLLVFCVLSVLRDVKQLVEARQVSDVLKFLERERERMH